MGTLFPERPDHVPMPSPTGEAAKIVGVAAVAVVLLSDHEHAHPHHEPHSPPPVSRHAMIEGSTSGSDVPFFGVVDSSDVAIRAHHARRQRWMQVLAASSGSTFVPLG